MTYVKGQSFLDKSLAYIETLDKKAQQQLVEFLECKPQTLRSWLRRKTTPSGIRAIRLHYLLEEVGITNPDWRCKNEIVQDVGRLVAFHVLTLEEVSARFNDPTVDVHAVLVFLNGSRHVKAANLDVLAGIVHEFNWDLPDAKHRWVHLCVKDKTSQKIAALAAKILDILPDAADMASDNWSAEDREELRDRCGSDTIFRLYNVLGALCGERARQHQLKSTTAAMCLKRQHK